MNKAPERIWINYAAANKVDLAYDEPPITPFDDVSQEYVRADRAELAQAPAPVRVKPWAYCPECGETATRHEERDHKQCAKCYQEWFADIDYSEVVRGNLNRLFLAALEAPDAGVVAELVEAAKGLQHAVCGPNGFADAVRHNTGLALPWPFLDAAEERLARALAKLEVR